MRYPHNEPITLTRDCNGLLIPAGTAVCLQKGTEVIITQSLGSSYTLFLQGNLVRIDGKDADALGKEPMSSALDSLNENASIDEKVQAQMKTCYDPEIPVNIVDLGLIYSYDITPIEGKPHSYTVAVTMTLTAPGCGMGPVLTMDVKQQLLAIPEIESAEVSLVFDPPWDQSRISEAAKLQLGLL